MNKYFSVFLALLCLASCSFEDKKLLESESNFQLLEGEYICNKVTEIFGYDPMNHYWETKQVCDKECNILRDVSAEIDYVHIWISPLEEIDQEYFIDNFNGVTKPMNITYESNLLGSYPNKKNLIGSCTNPDEEIYANCFAEDETITISIHNGYDNVLKEVGMPQSDIYVRFSVGGYGLTNYVGMPVSPDLFCKRI